MKALEIQDKRLPVDSEKLKRILSAKGITMTHISHDYGYGTNWMSNEIFYYKALTKGLIAFLTTEYGIKYSAIKPKEEVKKTETLNTTNHEDIETIKSDIKDIKDMLYKLMTELGCPEVIE